MLYDDLSQLLFDDCLKTHADAATARISMIVVIIGGFQYRDHLKRLRTTEATIMKWWRLCVGHGDDEILCACDTHTADDVIKAVFPWYSHGYEARPAELDLAGKPLGLPPPDHPCDVCAETWSRRLYDYYVDERNRIPPFVRLVRIFQRKSLVAAAMQRLEPELEPWGGINSPMASCVEEKFEDTRFVCRSFWDWFRWKIPHLKQP